MNLKNYIKDKQISIILRLVFLVFIIYILSLLRVENITINFILILWIVLTTIEMTYEYMKKASYYNKVANILKEIDKKYLLPVLIDEPDFLEGKIFYEVLSITDKSMNEEVNTYIHSQEEYQEYIDMWVHEIKTPISSSKLIIENNKNEQTLSLLEELEKIEDFIEQVLYYSKGNELEKDYIVKEINLRKCVNNSIKRNKKLIREKNIAIEIVDFENKIYCDSKWLEFILNQIISNSIKYITNTNEKLESKRSKIKIYTNQNENDIELFIEDNGIGIDEKDLKKVFQKGFTGINGRKLKKSTGMGLYISKKLSDKMYIGLSVESTIGEKTIVKIKFPKNNMTNI